MFETLKQIDREIFLLINGCNSPALDSLMVFISGKFSWIPLYAFLLFLLYKQQGKNIIYIIPAVVVLITLSDQGSVLLFKNTVQRLRPCHNESLKNLVHLVNGKCGGLFGFVSSHASNTMALSVFVFLFLKKEYGKFSLLLFLFPIIVAYSRVYLGIHYPADVVCGMLFGGILGSLCFYLFNKFLSEKLKIS